MLLSHQKERNLETEEIMADADIDTTTRDVESTIQMTKHSTGLIHHTSASKMTDAITDGNSFKVTTAPSKSILNFHTYRAQLTFGLSSGCKEVNVAALFLQWLEKSTALLANFSLLPYDGEGGQQIISTDQVEHDPAFYDQYYFNHRVLQHGNLTGMIQFQTSVPWISLKSPKSPYFNWLKECRVYMNRTAFKTDTLVACGFLVGAHPGFLRRDEAEEELKVSLDIEPDTLPFQLSSWSISVPIKDGDRSRFSFQAIVVETSVKHAQSLREKFYQLDPPHQAEASYPYTGKYQFVPLLKSKEWSLEKIYTLAKFHVSIIDGLQPLYISNLQDINNIIDEHGNSLMQGFYGMTIPSSTQQVREGSTASPLIYSVHNTSRLNMKAVLIKRDNIEEAIDQFTNIANILKTNIKQKFHPNVFIPGKIPALTGRQADSIFSCNSSATASALLNNFNPQDGEASSTTVANKRVRTINVTYAKIVTPTSNTLQSQNSLSTLTEIDKLYESMSTRFGEQFGTKISITELEQQVAKTSEEITTIRTSFNEQLTSIQTSVDQLTTKVDSQYLELNNTVQSLVDTIAKQNFVIAGIQQEFKLSMETLSNTLLPSARSNNHTPSTSATRGSYHVT